MCGWEACVLNISAMAFRKPTRLLVKVDGQNVVTSLTNSRYTNARFQKYLQKWSFGSHNSRLRWQSIFTYLNLLVSKDREVSVAQIFTISLWSARALLHLLFPHKRSFFATSTTFQKSILTQQFDIFFLFFFKFFLWCYGHLPCQWDAIQVFLKCPITPSSLKTAVFFHFITWKCRRIFFLRSKKFKTKKIFFFKKLFFEIFFVNFSIGDHKKAISFLFRWFRWQ